MSLLDSAKLALAVAEKKLGIGKEASKGSEPLGARIGGLAKLPIGDFAACGKSLTSFPSNFQPEIVSIGRVKGIELVGQKLYRFYVQDVDGPAGSEKFIQALLGDDGIPVELAWYETLRRFVPSAEEMEIFQGLRGVEGVGGQEFGLSAADLESCVGPERAAEALGGAEGLSWIRAIAPEKDFVAPIEARETQLDSADGVKGLSREAKFMIYGREIEGGVERLMVEWRKVDSRNGQPAEEYWVDVLVGLPLDAEKVKFI